MKKREYSLGMNFVISQSHSVNNDNMFTRWDMKPYAF